MTAGAKKAPDRNAPGKKAAGKKAGEMQAGEKKAGEKKTGEKKTGEKKTPDKQTVDKLFAQLIAGYSPEVQDLARKARDLVREIVPGASEEIDLPAKMLVFTFIPGTYKGAILAIAPQKTYVNIMFGNGVELMAVDTKGLLEGTGKSARHIKIRSSEQIRDPAVRALTEEAVARTPRTR